MRGLLSFVLLAALPSIASANTWICVSEAATGFTKVGSGFVSAAYKEGRTYIMRPAKPEDTDRYYFENLTYVMETIGDTTGPYSLFRAEVKPGGGAVSSIGGTTTVEFNPTTLQFTLLSSFSYVFQTEQDRFPPFLEIGSCSAM
jgi:hypothetical protein